MPSSLFRPPSTLALAVLLLVGGATTARAAAEGGLYIADEKFSFSVAAERAMTQNPDGRRFFLLSLPPQTDALAPRAPPTLAALRQRVLAANGVLLVCQRDLDSGRLRRANLVDGVVAVRGWPPKGGEQMPAGARYFAGEDRTNLPAADEALRRLRSACA